MRWDSSWLYVGAELRDRFVWANLTGHNLVAPYHDNDFEVFIDPSGSSHWYKEFEMSARNATYDVLWGVPDQWGLLCSPNASELLPVCVNTSFPGYPGSWSMAPAMQTATYTPSWKEYGNHGWSLEVRFPMHPGDKHGGLLDGLTNTHRFDPAQGDRLPGLPQYWWIDFARAEHPRAYIAEGGREVLCPLNCSDGLERATPVLSNPSTLQCAAAAAGWPTLLGSDTFYGCYWEWVWQSLGSEAYMHRPQLWGMLQFVDPTTSSRGALCRNIEFPGRHVAESLFLAERSYAAEHLSLIHI
eukprot:TRINITY_DN36288_c0_g1_i2.p1 TRINITY_DN36288_c0_g1~~TRINITY_DN36288_c0_g1_i2.p1  ORF type:complete len:299 (-),score=39.37 TRINITY_DN36288_c0_g1_i2:174-1070(-)